MAGDELVVVGAGGFGREVVDVAAAAGFAVAGFVDDGEPDAELLARRGQALLGPIELLATWPGACVIAIAAGPVRAAIAEQVEAWGTTLASIVHPTAVAGEDVAWGAGFVACAHVSLTTNIRFGRHCHVNLNATVGHDCRIGDFVTINPGANISGDVRIGDGVMIGTGAAVIQGVEIGAGATIGAGAVVVRDVPQGVTAVGVPARPLR